MLLTVTVARESTWEREGDDETQEYFCWNFCSIFHFAPWRSYLYFDAVMLCEDSLLSLSFPKMKKNRWLTRRPTVWAARQKLFYHPINKSSLYSMPHERDWWKKSLNTNFSLARAVVTALCLLHSAEKLFVQVTTSWQSGYIRSQHKSIFNLRFHI